MEEHIRGGKVVNEWVVEDVEFLQKQKRIVLRNCGEIDPYSPDAYGYRALKKALTEMTPEQLIEVIADSGLRGRGGAGFSTGTKWRLARAAKDEHKYVVCNADEGDPGAFMDRSVLEGDPHSVLEGMAIAAYAIGADQGYVYARAEYPQAVRRLRYVIAQAEENGIDMRVLSRSRRTFSRNFRCNADLYRRTRAEMPAHHEEVEAAEKEGVRLEILAVPTEVITKTDFLATGALISLTKGPLKVAERTLFREHWSFLKPGDVELTASAQRIMRRIRR